MTAYVDADRSTVVPSSIRLTFSHAALQVIADHTSVDILHIKGIAVNPLIRGGSGSGSDADVLVRPSHVPRLLTQLQRQGWRHHTDFESGSPFGHAATLYHDSWGFGDVHRHFPGITMAAPDAFDQLWAGRTSMSLAGVSCAVPSLPAQLLIMVLNAARSGGATTRMALVRSVWDESPPELREQVTSLVVSLRAEVAFSAGLGELEQFRGRRDYLLWKVASRGGTRLEEWIARVRAAPTTRAAFTVALRAPLVNIDHLALRIGHRPSRLEVLREFVARPARGVAQELARIRNRRG